MKNQVKLFCRVFCQKTYLVSFFLLVANVLYSQTASISVNGINVSSGGTISACQATTISFDVSYTGVGSAPSFAWTFQNGNPGSDNIKAPNVTFNTTGNKTVTINVFGTDTATSNVTVLVEAAISNVTISNTGSSTICYNLSAPELTAVVTGGIGPIQYQWERKIGAGAWNNVGSNSSTFDDGTNLTQNTSYRVTAISSGNCGTQLSNIINIIVQPLVVSPVISSAQTICHNTAPSALTRTNASGGNGSFTYQWQYSANGTSSWQNTGQTGLSYSPGILTADRWFRVEAVSSCGAIYSNVIKVTVRAALSAGSISPSNPQLCYNTSQALTLSGVAGGDGVYSYIWETKPVGSGSWSLAPGSTNSTSYNTGNLTQSAEYRVRVNSGCGVEAITPTRTVNVAAVFSIGTISLTGPSTICYNTTPGQMTIAASGGRTPYSYQWERKIGAGTWQNVGTNSSTYTEGTNLTASSEYRVTVTAAGGCGVFTSATSAITVLSNISTSVISSAQTICHNTIPAMLSRTNATGSDGNFVYEWQYSTTGTGNWQNTGQSGLGYSPGVLTADRWFRVRVDNSCATTYSNIVKVTVYAVLSAGNLLPSSPQICYNTGQLLTVSGTSGGDASYSYIWERRLVGNTTWLSAPGATSSSSYNTGNLVQSYEYRVRVNSGCGVESISNIATVDVAGQLGISAISLVGSSTICHNTLPGQMSVSASGGRTPYSYQWERKIGAGTWQNVGSNSSSYAESTLLTQNTSYRVTATSSAGCGSITSAEQLITVRPAITTPTISAAQTICYNTQSAALTRTNASGSDGSFTYNWEYSLNGTSNWINTGQSGMTYNPGVLTASRWYRVKVINSTCSGLVYSNIIKINVRQPLVAGSVTPVYTEICYNTGTTLNLSGTAGADSIYQRTWQRSIPGSGIWTTAPGSSNVVNFNTGNLSVSYDYRVIVNTACNVPDTTNTVSVNVAPEFVGGIVSVANQEDSVCFNQTPVLLSASGFAGGRLPYTYVWEKRFSSGSWDTIGSNSPTYQDPSKLLEDAFYRLRVTSDTGCGSILTDSIRIRVNPLPSSDSSVILGPYAVCSNAQGVMYQLYPGYPDSIQWSFSSGMIINQDQDRVIIDFDNLNVTAIDTLYANLINTRTKCERVVRIPITITDNDAPNKADIIQKPNTNILVCSDETPGLSFQWGYYKRENGQEVLITGANLRYCQYPSAIDTLTNLYFVRTSLNGCSSTSYFGLGAAPFGEEEWALMQEFILYPNPSRGEVLLRGNLERIETVTLVSMAGLQFKVLVDRESGTLDLPDTLPSGLYVVLLRTETGVQSINLSILNP